MLSTKSNVHDPIAPDLGNVIVPFVLSPEQVARLAQDGFVVSPGVEKEFFTVYEQARYANVPTFITSDSLLYVYHLLFDKVLRTAERQAFIPALQQLNEAMLAQTDLQYQALRLAQAQAARRGDARADEYGAQAQALARAIDRHFWREDRGLYMSYIGTAAHPVPFEAYDAPGILDDADGGRWMVAELGRELGAAGLAEAAAPMLAPYPCDEALAREHVLETADPFRRTELASVPGSVEAMALGLVDAVAGGIDDPDAQALGLGHGLAALAVEVPPDR